MNRYETGERDDRVGGRVGRTGRPLSSLWSRHRREGYEFLTGMNWCRFFRESRKLQESRINGAGRYGRSLPGGLRTFEFPVEV